MKTYKELINDVATKLVEDNIAAEFGGSQGNKGISDDTLHLLSSVSGIDTNIIEHDIKVLETRKRNAAFANWKQVLNGTFDYQTS